MKNWEMIGKRIQETLKEKNMTQKELAEKIGVKQGTLSTWLIGKVPIKSSNVELIADILNVPYQYFVTGKYPDFGEIEPQGEIKTVTFEIDGIKTTIQLSEAEIERLNKKTIKLTRREKDFLDCFKTSGWIGRDIDNRLYLYPLPIGQNKWTKMWTYSFSGIDADAEETSFELDSDLFPFITWESEKAWSVEELSKLEVRD